MTAPSASAFPDVAARNSLQASFEVPVLLRALQAPAGGRVLEVGCGRGVALPVIARLLKPSFLAGLDIDSTLLAVAAQRLAATSTAATLVVGDLQTLPFADAAFDLVIDFGTSYHVANPARALAEVARVLAHAGYLLHETPLAQHVAHPIRSFGRTLPWNRVPVLQSDRRALFWSRRRRV
jgi:ubiquinone/menaquinone biosynthesis C-methylase UbiE